MKYVAILVLIFLPFYAKSQFKPTDTFSKLVISYPVDSFRFNLSKPVFKGKIVCVKCYDLIIRGQNGQNSLTIDTSGKMVITDSLSAIKSLLMYVQYGHKK